MKYNETLFKWDDQVRLAEALSRARDRGVKIVATNAAHSAVVDLYRQRTFTVQFARRYSSISGESKGRSEFRELIILANCSEDMQWRKRPPSNLSSKRLVTKGTRFRF